MSRVIDKQAKRLRFLHTLYEQSDGDTLAVFDMYEVGRELGFTSDETTAITDYLAQEGLVKYFTFGGNIVLTHAGLVEVEEALGNPSRATRHFTPAAINHITIQNMSHSTLMQGSHGATQNATINPGQAATLKDALPDIRKGIQDLPLDEVQRREADAELATLEAQASSSNPKGMIITETLKSLRAIAEGATGGAIGTGVVTLIGSVLGGV